MYCERYKCRMSELSCLARRRNSIESNLKWSPNGHMMKPGAGDESCKNCVQGKEIAKKHGRDELEAYSKDLKNIRKRALTKAIKSKNKKELIMPEHPPVNIDVPVPGPPAADGESIIKQLITMRDYYEKVIAKLDTAIDVVREVIGK
jgi:hypothetical protein